MVYTKIKSSSHPKKFCMKECGSLPEEQNCGKNNLYDSEGFLAPLKILWLGPITHFQRLDEAGHGDKTRLSGLTKILQEN